MARTSKSFIALVLVGVFSFTGAWQFGWWAAGTASSRTRYPASVVEPADRMAVLLCALVPSLSFCPPRMQVVRVAANAEGKSYRELFASLPDFEAAVEKLRWNRGSEAEAARLMSVLHALVLAHAGESQRPARRQIEQLVVAAWQAHPQLVTASVCADCYDAADFIDQQLATRAPDATWVGDVAAGHPKRLHLLGSAGKLAPERIRVLASVHGELEYAGTAGGARYVADALIEEKRYATLRAWVSKGLNGSSGIRESDLSSLPPELVKSAWEHGVGIGYPEPELTGYLLKKGHRPALRWVLWILDGSAAGPGNRHTSVIQDLARRHIDFGVPEGREMARFYSAYWREITWDRERETWRRMPAAP